MHGVSFHRDLAHLRVEFNALQREHAARHLRSDVEERAHIDRFNQWIQDVEQFRRVYLDHPRRAR